LALLPLLRLLPLLAPLSLLIALTLAVPLHPLPRPLLQRLHPARQAPGPIERFVLVVVRFRLSDRGGRLIELPAETVDAVGDIALHRVHRLARGAAEHLTRVADLVPQAAVANRVGGVGHFARRFLLIAACVA